MEQIEQSKRVREHIGGISTVINKIVFLFPRPLESPLPQLTIVGRRV